jgi:hypothetical protein
MNQVTDIWYVRFPDGRVVRAPSTDALRQHVEAGHIPSASRVRRFPDDEWVALDWTEEFADALPVPRTGHSVRPALSNRGGHGFDHGGDGTNLASRLDPTRLKTVGLRGLVEELVAALDSALSRMKLLISGVAGVASAIILALVGGAAKYLPWSDTAWIWTAAGVFVLLIGVAAVVPITQMTYVELSRLRPARWREARAGWFWSALHLLIALVVTAGASGTAIYFLRWWPDQLLPERKPDVIAFAPDLAAAAVNIVTMLVEILLWPIVGFTLLLAPIIVIEERTALSAIVQWWHLIRRHAGRLFLYESTAVLGGVANLAFALPLLLLCWGRVEDWRGVGTAFGFSLCALAGLAAAPLIAYLTVAQVFIYLHLRYEVEPARRA